MSLCQKVRDAYLAKQGQTRQPQPQQPQPDINTFYLRQRLAPPQRPRRRIVQPEKKTVDVLRDAMGFLNDEKP